MTRFKISRPGYMDNDKTQDNNVIVELIAIWVWLRLWSTTTKLLITDRGTISCTRKCIGWWRIPRCIQKVSFAQARCATVHFSAFARQPSVASQKAYDDDVCCAASGSNLKTHKKNTSNINCAITKSYDLRLLEAVWPIFSILYTKVIPSRFYNQKPAE